MFQRTTAVDKILKMTKKLRVIPGGSSAGKTVAILAVLIDTAIKNPSKRIDVVSMTYDHLRDGAIADFKMIMETTKRWVPEYWHDTKHIYTFSNKSFIRFKAIDNEGKARGPRRDILYVNESNYISYETFYQLEIRTNDCIYLDYNPSNRFWVDDEVIPSKDAEKLVLTYRDNEALNENILKGFAEKRQKAETSDYWKNWCNVYLDGQIGRIEGVIFTNWKEIESIPKDAELIGYGMDFGFTNDPTTCMAVYRFNNEIIIDQIIYKTGLFANDIVRLLKQNDVDESSDIFGDSAEPRLISEIRSGGFNIRKVDKGADSIVFGLSLMQEQTLRITSRSRETIEEFNRYSWIKNKDGMSEQNRPEDTFNHTIDAIRYLFLMKMRNGMGDGSFDFDYIDL